MGVVDTATAVYLRQDDIFADAFNYYLYKGKQVIHPDSLTRLDSYQVTVPYGDSQSQSQPVWRLRDVANSVTAMADDKSAYMILAVENQAYVHQAMAVRNMVYDALQYAEQVKKAADSHKLADEYRGISGDEYLSGFLKTDRLEVSLGSAGNTNIYQIFRRARQAECGN